MPKTRGGGPISHSQKAEQATATPKAEGSLAIYQDRAGANRDVKRTEGASYGGETRRQALLAIEEAKAREKQEAEIERRKADALALENA